MMFNNLTTGLFLVAALGELARPQIFTAAANAAYPIALVFLFADLFCLVLDLGDPRRFHHMLRVFKPSSPMSLGTWFLTAYSVPLTLIVATELLPGAAGFLGWVRLAALVVGLPFALGAAVYKGVLFSTSSQPGWKDARWLGAYLTSAAVLLGCAEMLALSLLMGQERAAAILRLALALLLMVNAVPLFLVIGEFRTAVGRVYTRKQLLGVGAIVLGGGMLLPFGLVLVGGPFALAAAVGFVLLGSLAGRYVIVKLPHAPH